LLLHEVTSTAPVAAVSVLAGHAFGIVTDWLVTQPETHVPPGYVETLLEHIT
jgi:hypothetical protein